MDSPWCGQDKFGLKMETVATVLSAASGKPPQMFAEEPQFLPSGLPRPMPRHASHWRVRQNEM